MTPIDLDVRQTGRRSALQTIRGVLFDPRRWFSNLPTNGTGRALGIAMLVRLVADPIAALGMNLWEPVPPGKVVASFLAAPLSVLISIYLQAPIVWALTRMPGKGRARFGTVVQCLAYAQIAGLLGIVPVIGPIAAIAWYLCLCAIGLRTALRLSWVSASSLVLAGPVIVAALAFGVRTSFVEAFRSRARACLQRSWSVTTSSSANSHMA